MTHKKEFILCHSTNRQNQARLLEIQTIITVREIGKDLVGERLEGSFKKLVTFCFLILVLVSWVCLLCENSSNYLVFITCSLYYVCYFFIFLKKQSDFLF